MVLTTHTEMTSRGLASSMGLILPPISVLANNLRVKVAVLDRESMHEGARLNHIAMREFVTRTASGDWSCPEPHQITVSIFERPDQEVTSDESAA